MTSLAATLTRGSIKGRVGLITGAGGGVGEAVARHLAALGARLALVDVDTAKLDALVRAIEQAGGEASPITASVTDPNAIQSATRSAAERFGGLNFAVCCAAVADSGSLAEGDPEQWRMVVDVNLLGTLYTARAVFKHLQEGGGGDVIILGSVSGLETYEGEPLYLASKWGLVGLGRSLRKEGRPDRIRVTLIEPGLIDTPLSRRSKFGARLLESTRPLKPADVADLIVFALLQPSYADLGELVVRPIEQEI
jgi:NADP-dependent 3-hydroxy acid dehydrogenase YdfG